MREVIENLGMCEDDQGGLPGGRWLGGRTGPREVEGAGNGQEDISGWGSVVTQVLPGVSLLAYAPPVQKGPEDSNPNLLPLMWGFTSETRCPDFTYGDILEPTGPPGI